MKNRQYIKLILNTYSISIIILVISTFSFFTNNVFAVTLKGGVSTYSLKNEKIKLNFNTTLNYYFSLVGDKVSAYINEDIKIGENNIIPRGSIIEGVISNIKEPARLGVDGGFDIELNRIITPDKKKIDIIASASTDTSSPSKTISKILTYDAALITYGALNGAIAGLQWGGLSLALSSHGISILGGSAFGASCGLVGSVIRKGKMPTGSTFGNSEIILKSDLTVIGDLPDQATSYKPQATSHSEYQGFRFHEALKKDDVELKINNIKKEKQENFGSYIILDVLIKNNSQKKFNFGNLLLLSEEKNISLQPDVFLSGRDIFKIINPYEEVNAMLAFVVNSKDKYELALMDTLDNTEVVRIPLP